MFWSVRKLAFHSTGISVSTKNPIIKYENGHGNLKAQLLSAGKECAQKFGGLPNLIVVVLPNGAGEIRHAIKQ